VELIAQDAGRESRSADHLLSPGSSIGLHLRPRMGKPVNQNGFSDHFPIIMTVTEAD
jgi:hypothetical protein